MNAIQRSSIVSQNGGAGLIAIRKHFGGQVASPEHDRRCLWPRQLNERSGTLAEACAKTDWQVHAYCLMKTHFHLVVETPRAKA